MTVLIAIGILLFCLAAFGVACWIEAKLDEEKAELQGKLELTREAFLDALSERRITT